MNDDLEAEVALRLSLFGPYRRAGPPPDDAWWGGRLQFLALGFDHPANRAPVPIPERLRVTHHSDGTTTREPGALSPLGR
eukprot:4089802-Alexandrium_andersonii.AAC.1